MAIKGEKKPFWSRGSSRRETQKVKESREEFLKIDIGKDAIINKDDGQNEPSAIRIEMKNGSSDERAAATANQGENATLIDLANRPTNNGNSENRGEDVTPNKQCQIF